MSSHNPPPISHKTQFYKKKYVVQYVIIRLNNRTELASLQGLSPVNLSPIYIYIYDERL